MDFFIGLLVLFLSLCVTNLYVPSVSSIWISGNLERILFRDRMLLKAVEFFPSFFKYSVSPEQLVPTGESTYEAWKKQKSENTVVSYSIFLALHNILTAKNASFKEKIIKALQFHSRINLFTFLPYTIVLNFWLFFSGYPLTHFGWLVPVFLFVAHTVSAMIVEVTRLFFIKLLWRYGSGRLSYSLATLLDG
jgi:hypothetical protein